jgi:hypothetical protein
LRSIERFLHFYDATRQHRKIKRNYTPLSPSSALWKKELMLPPKVVTAAMTATATNATNNPYSTIVAPR